MPYVAVPDKNSGDVFTTAMWTTYLEGNLNAGVERPIYDSGVIGVAVASIDIASIPATFAHLRLKCFLRGDTAAVTINPCIRFNNDSAANYDYQGFFQNNGALTANAAALAQTLAIVGFGAPAGTGYTNSFAAITIEIPNYADAANFATYTSVFGAESTNLATGLYNGIYTGLWHNVAAITRITLLPAAGNFAVGSRVTLLGTPYI